MNSIVFFGSGPVAAKSLELLHKTQPIEAVITKPAPPHHRGQVPVIATAKALGLPILLAANSHELDKLFADQAIKSRLGVLIDFGIMVSQSVIDYFALGIINSHFSILPEWRGADPISFAILSGQPQTGVSLMQLTTKLDEGPLLTYGVYDLPPDITGPQLTEDLIKLSHSLLRQTLPGYMAKPYSGIPQMATKRPVSYSHKLTKADGLINWHKPAVQLEREIRAYLEWPRSRTTLADKEVIITEAQVVDKQGSPATTRADNGKLIVYCQTNALEIERLQPAGKPEMTAKAFLAGYKLT